MPNINLQSNRAERISSCSGQYIARLFSLLYTLEHNGQARKAVAAHNPANANSLTKTPGELSPCNATLSRQPTSTVLTGSESGAAQKEACNCVCFCGKPA